MKKRYSVATLPDEFRKLIPEELARMLNYPVCSFHEGASNFDVKPKKSIMFTVDMSSRDGINNFFHELCHFAAVPEERCGIMDFGFIYDVDYGYPLPTRNYAPVLHEAEVFGRERNIARFFSANMRIAGSEQQTMRDIPGYYNYLGRHP